MDYRAAIISVVFGVLMYGYLSLVLMPAHYIHLMFVTLITCVVLAVAISRWVFGSKPSLNIGRKEDAAAAEA